MPSVTSRNGPALWDALLEALNVDGAVIAGGCIRDYMLGLEPKDIDICIPAKNTEDFWNLVGNIDEHLFDLSDCRDNSEYEEDAPVLFGVLEGEGLGVTVNIIGRSDYSTGCVQDLVRGFDFYVLQGWYSNSRDMDKGGGLNCLPAMLRDIQNKTATLAHERHREQSITRFDRFNKRNPGILRLNDQFKLDVC